MIVSAATSVDPPNRLHVYIVDTKGDASLDALTGAHCPDVIRLHEVERVDRLVRRLATELDRRRSESAADRGPDVVVAIDGLAALRESLEHVERGSSLAELDRVLADGPAVGIATIAVLDAARGGGTALARFAQRWVFHLDDPTDAPTLGVATTRVPRAIPGRLIVAASGLEAQVAILERDPLHGDGGPAAVGVLPRYVPAHSLGGQRARLETADALPVGLDFATLSTAVLHVPIGEHAVIVGPARSGRSSALIRLIEAWRALHPGAPVRVICPTRSSPLVDRYDAAANLDDVRDVGALIAVDDCERFDDPDGRLAAHLGRAAGATVFAAGRADSMRVAYGHWTAVCRRSRLGLAMAAGSEIDGDLLGAIVPRRPPIPARPGLAWLVDGSGQSLVQLALDGWGSRWGGRHDGALVTQDVAGAGAELGGDVVGVPDRARLERQAPAADAAVEVLTQPLQRRDLLVETWAPARRQVGPVVAVRRAPLGQQLERRLDLGERQPDLLGDADEADPAQHVGVIAAVIGVRPVRRDQPVFLVEPQGRRGDPGPGRDLPDREALDFNHC